MNSRLLIGFLLIILLAALAFAVYLISEIGAVEISVHGWIAMGLGLVLSLVLGVGLMMLAYHSHKRGYDDEAHARQTEADRAADRGADLGADRGADR